MVVLYMTLHFKDLEKIPTIDGKEYAAASVLSASADYTTFSPYRSMFKRGFDVALVLLAAPLVLTIVLLCALLVMSDGHNPFYVQKRIGRNGRLLRMWKLRTMVPNAHEKLQQYLLQNPAAREEWDRDQKLKNDPRITRVGRVLRKTSLDELPQLWNVLNGTMSLVGPRPMMIEQADMYIGKAYYRLRPGITGMWQISDRNECRFIDRVRFDELYDQCLSLKTDIAILWRTIAVVLRGTGY